MAEERLEYLFARYRSELCTAEELQELSLLCLLPENQSSVEKLTETIWEQIPLDQDIPGNAGEIILQRILDPSLQEPADEPGIVRKLRWRRIAVAASVILLLGTGSYFLFFNKKEMQKEIVTKQQSDDIAAPATARATLKLDDGRIVYLDSTKNGSLAIEGRVMVTKLADGRIAYKVDSAGEKEEKYNTVTNPRGSKVVNLILADGTAVWLNSESSLKYPVAFIGTNRRVEITGEAYFEVAKDRTKKFIVGAGDVNTEVFGTHFNVNAYADEDEIKITLLEGSVKVTRAGSLKFLKPGQQAQVGSDVKVENGINLEEVMAWKNGKFLFNKTNVQTTMRQIARWYDVDIEYQGEVKGFFSGSIERKENASQVLKMLGMTDEVHFEINGKKILVKP